MGFGDVVQLFPNGGGAAGAGPSRVGGASQAGPSASPPDPSANRFAMPSLDDATAHGTGVPNLGTPGAPSGAAAGAGGGVSSGVVGANVGQAEAPARSAASIAVHRETPTVWSRAKQGYHLVRSIPWWGWALMLAGTVWYYHRRGRNKPLVPAFLRPGAKKAKAVVIDVEAED